MTDDSGARPVTPPASLVSPLEGVRVFALEHFIAGPYCTQILADAGAEVVKIERPGVGDPRRWYDPYVEQDGVRVSGGFETYNRSKKSLSLDMTGEGAREILLRLLEDADVVVENMRPGVLAKAGLSYGEIAARNPRIVYCAISGFGRTQARRGPYSDWPAFDPIIQALGGLASLIGEEGRRPELAPAGSVDLLAGTWAAMAVLMALLQRSSTGRGQFVDVSMYDVLVSFLGRPLMIHDWTGETMTRGGDSFTPVGMFACGHGGHVAIIIPTDDLWQRTCTAIGREGLIARQDLNTNLKRSRAMRTVIVPELEAWAAELTRREACEQLMTLGVPAGMVQTVDEVYASPHLRARDLFATLDDPVSGQHRYPRLPVLFGQFQPTYRRSPRLGEHTDEVLGRAGVDEVERAGLRQRGVIE